MPLASAKSAWYAGQMVGRLGVVALFLVSCGAPQGVDPAPRPVSVEAYVSKVPAGHQMPLRGAAVPFAQYLNGIHNRIHPIFADGYLGALDKRPKTDPLNDPKRTTRVELVIGRDGFIVTMGIVKTSGLADFDAAALAAFGKAQPFGAPPDAILSSDGEVYLQWELRRDEVFACSTMNARPFLLGGLTPPADRDAGVLNL